MRLLNTVFYVELFYVLGLNLSHWSIIVIKPADCILQCKLSLREKSTLTIVTTPLLLLIWLILFHTLPNDMWAHKHNTNIPHTPVKHFMSQESKSHMPQKTIKGTNNDYQSPFSQIKQTYQLDVIVCPGYHMDWSALAQKWLRLSMSKIEWPLMIDISFILSKYKHEQWLMVFLNVQIRSTENEWGWRIF